VCLDHAAYHEQIISTFLQYNMELKTECNLEELKSLLNSLLPERKAIAFGLLSLRNTGTKARWLR